MTDNIRDRTSDSWRALTVTRKGGGRFEATNRRGGVLPIGDGDDDDFTPVELLLASLAGCAASNVDAITSRRAVPTTFAISAEGHKIRDDAGNHLVDLKVTVDITFPEGPDGDRAREMLPRAVQQTHDRICTVSRTVALGEPVDYVVGEVNL
jgi:putative redox protein